jgi:uncharacterized membrane protein
MKSIFSHFKVNVFRGILAMIPVALSIFAIIFIYNVIDKRVVELIGEHIGFSVPGLGICILVICLYLIGLIASNVLGKRMISLVEMILDRIPIIRTTYQVGKQVANTFSLHERQVIKKAVLVDFFKPNTWVVGFIMGYISDKKTGAKMCKIFIPTVPNPTSGFLAIIKEEQTVDPKWTIEEAMKMVISGGIIGPEVIN